MQEGTGPGQYDAAWLQRFVRQLSEFEGRMNQVVVDSGILAHVPPGSLAAAGRVPSQAFSSHQQQHSKLRVRVTKDHAPACWQWSMAKLLIPCPDCSAKGGSAVSPRGLRLEMCAGLVAS